MANPNCAARKRRAFLMSACLLCGLLSAYPIETAAAAGESGQLYGDVTGDGRINAYDLYFVHGNLLGTMVGYPSAQGDAAADVTGDGVVDQSDLDALQAYLVRKTNSLPMQGSVPVSYDVYFAVDAAYQNGVSETTNAGYLNEAYLNLDNMTGSYVEWTVQVENAGNYQLMFRGANGGDADRPMKLTLNGGADTWTIAFPSTGAWTTWTDTEIIVPLQAGTNTIRLTSSTENGGPNLDYLDLEMTTAAAAAPDSAETVTPETELTLADVPSDYTYALDWIWTNRIQNEKSTERRNTIFDQIVAGEGTINYVVRWQSYKTITLEQRQKLEVMLDEAINGWTDWLVNYDGWEYDHVDVKIVGWAVLDKSCLLDLQEDEIVYDYLLSDYDSSYDTSNGVEEIPNLLPSAPSELSRFDRFSAGLGYDYPGGLDKRFDMYLWATQGFPSIGGCGGDWGQRLSDDAYLNMINSGSGIHVLEHEIGHGFGLTDFYGGEGESDGFPPGGFPGGENSLMMAGSASKITDFDGWMLRYVWSNIKDEAGRFN